MKGTRGAIIPATNATSREKPVELRDEHAAFRCFGRGWGSRELRPAIEGIGAFASFASTYSAITVMHSGFREARGGCALRLNLIRSDRISSSISSWASVSPISSAWADAASRWGSIRSRVFAVFLHGKKPRHGNQQRANT
jgi:hypothetical protein